MTKMRILAVLCGLALAVPAGRARAEGLQGSGSDRPWAQGVSEDDQRTALDLFTQGNKLLKESIFVQAAAKYREALKHWDHPAIHYNMALALLNLDQPVEVREHLVAAMKYGAAPLDEEKFTQAQSYQELIEKELARVKIACSEPGARVTLDGQPLFTAPGSYENFVRAGPHSISATKEGFIPFEVSRPLPAGELTTLDMKLYTQEELTEYRRRWSTWVPWSVVAGGAVLAGSGALLQQSASSHYKTFDQGISQCGGCVPSGSVASARSTGNTLQTAALAAYGVGGAAIVTGAVLVYMNRLMPYHADQKVDVVDKPQVSVSPYLAPNGGGLVAAARF